MNKPASIIYAGTPEFALPPLQALFQAGFKIAAVYTQPDRKAGRGRKLAASPVKCWALEAGLNVEQPQSLRAPGQQSVLAAYLPDLMVVTAYGLILPEEILTIPRCGCVNLHASLLPRWRGAAPVQRAIMAGDTETGVTLMRMNSGLDTGPMLAKRKTSIAAEENSTELHHRIARLGAELLLEKLPALLAGRLEGEQQDDTQASYANKITKGEAWMDWDRSSHQLACQVRAFNPWPVAQTHWGEQVVRIWRAVAAKVDGAEAARPGEVIHAEEDGIDVCCGEGVLRVEQLQLPGGRVVSSADFIHAHDIYGALLN